MLLLLKLFISYTSVSLKRFIFTATMIVSAVTFITVMGTVSWLFLRQADETASKHSAELSQQAMNSIYRAMEDGSNLAQINSFLGEYQKTFQAQYEITIFPDSSIKAYIQAGREKSEDVDKVFTSGTATHIRTIYSVDHLFPVKAEKKCLSCHTTAKSGQILAVISIREDISSVRDAMLQKILLGFCILLPIPLFMSFSVSRFVNRHLGLAVERLHKKVNSVNSVADLSTLQLTQDSGNSSFKELEQVFKEFEVFVSRIKDVAVGKEMLELEIKVLEGFVITSDAIKDWKERVGFLLNELNNVLPAYAIFCVFQLQEELFDIEIFWTHAPSQNTRLVMEGIVRHKLVNHELGFATAAAEAQINHNVINSKTDLPELQKNDIEMQTKSLFLASPQVGGVVGIGVQSTIVSDPIRSLVINSILTTLINVVGSIKAIYKYTQDLEYYATRDPLTNLFNQRVFWELLSYEIGRAERHNDNFGLLVIDLDNFKHINDVYGHLVGDNYLRNVADKIHECLRLGDILARYGGDEFAIVIPEADHEQSYMIADRIRMSLDEMVVLTPNGEKIHGTASIGMAIFPVHAKTAKDLFLFADNMTYKAKHLGRNCVILPTEEDVAEVFEKSSDLSKQLITAIEEKRIFPYFQPIVTTDTRKVVYHEVLCRVEVDGKIINAAEFIEIAEKLSIITRLDSILIEKVFAKVKETGYTGCLFLNLSPKSLVLKEFVPDVIRLASQYDIVHERIVFEITERETVRNMTLLEKFVTLLRMDGFKFAIDDFGSGFSSFQYIRRFPIDYVKIDGDFVRNMLSDQKDQAFVKTLALLAKEFGILTIAEYIENEDLLKAVHSYGIDFAQGYYTGMPGPDLILE